MRGALALALPLRFGQAMEVQFTPGDETSIDWTATDPGGTWFEAKIIRENGLRITGAGDPEVAGRLVALLNSARSLNPEFLAGSGRYQVNCQLAFNRKWGWGSSSTLISNVAQWAGVDPFALNLLVSEGSGYDIACARSDYPIFFKLREGQPLVEPIRFQPAFYQHFAFVYLRRKQQTSSEINLFRPDPAELEPAITEISEISVRLAASDSLQRFNGLIDRHEEIIGKILKRPTVKEILFPGYGGSIKSLGAWGGDFILASSEHNYKTTVHYFREEGYPTVFSWNDIIR
jgi:hypothetical protein